MAFQIKDFRSVVASMINVSRASQSQITDFSVGSVARTLMEASAIEIEELYLQMLLGLQEAIPTAVYTSFDFGKLPAVAASGRVRFYRENAATPILIPAGSRVTSAVAGLEYYALAATVLTGAALYVDVLVVCLSTGAQTNCPGNSLTRLVSTISGITAVSNPLAFENGSDLESDEDRKIRFSAYIQTLTRGTVSALQYGASQSLVTSPSGDIIERARFIAVIEPFLTDPSVPVGLVQLYIHNGVGSTSAALVAAVLRDVVGYVTDQGTAVPGWKAAGVQVEVIAAEEVIVNVSAVVTMQDGAAAAPARALAALLAGEYIKGLGIGVNVIESELVALVMAVEGVYNVVLSAPTADVAISATQKAMPGAVVLQ